MLEGIYFRAPSDQETLNKILKDLRSKGYITQYVKDILSGTDIFIIRSNIYDIKTLTYDFYSEEVLEHCHTHFLVPYEYANTQPINIF